MNFLRQTVDRNEREGKWTKEEAEKVREVGRGGWS